MQSGTSKLIDRVVVIILVVSFGSWLIGLAGSPLFHPERTAATTASDRSVDHDPLEPALARAYWDRYPDVAGHSYFGENGVLGTDGARAHYQLHGKAEGRRWGFAPSEEVGDETLHRSPKEHCSEEETGRPNR